MFSFFSVPSKAGNISPKIAPWACAIYDVSKPFSVIGYGTNEVEARINVNLKCTRLLLQNKICEKLAICEAQDETKIDAWICVVYNPGAWEGRG
ncbi:MAG: hypothetical protein ACXVCN_20020, partial [Bdellovibrio sp.]